MARKVTGIRTDVIVDHETGEIKSRREERTAYIEQEPPYVKLYLDNVLFLSDLPKGLSGILMALLERMPYTGKGFAINGAIRREIAKELGSTEGSIRNAIMNLTKGNLLIRIDTGLYQFNPYFFGRGDWKDIERLRLEITYDYRGRTFMTEVKHFEENRRKQLNGQERMALPEGMGDEND